MPVVIPDIVIEATGLTKSFAAAPVLRGIDLTIRTGSTAITGPSGSGKSTLLALLGLMSRRDGGRLRIFGTDVALRPSAATVNGVRSRMAWLPQLPIVLPGRSSLDNVLTGVRARRAVVQADVDSAYALFGRLGIEHLADRNVSVLSGGELQKVALVRALTVSPDIILADEPTASLDETSTRSTIDALMTAAAHSSLVVASHDPAVAAACERVIAIRDGVVDAR
jgi:ABC-type lipoprotein export system ATPase subunit